MNDFTGRIIKSKALRKVPIVTPDPTKLYYAVIAPPPIPTPPTYTAPSAPVGGANYVKLLTEPYSDERYKYYQERYGYRVAYVGGSYWVSV